jgi:RHH-type proline utilization regulon transcriptional repressor/proline dehydrogenase/delta 1-pyrroline-5-carboxylate dehydrogenase
MASNLPLFVRDETPSADEASRRLDAAWSLQEAEHVAYLEGQIRLDREARDRIADKAVSLVERVRERSKDAGAMEAFMREYDLSSEEGVVLMCLAEALLRIPDSETAEQLIADKLAGADWEAHLGRSDSLFVNASTWGLMLTGRVVRLKTSTMGNLGSVMGRLVNRSGEPVIRVAIRQAMRIMGHQYVMGRTIDDALERSRRRENRRFRYSFDMLGEAALTAEDAARYKRSYESAIRAIGRTTDNDEIFSLPSISVKLSALHPRYEHGREQQVLEQITPILAELAILAKEQGIALTVDAEEADRLQLSLKVFERVLGDPELAGWDGLGLALQAYQKRAWTAIEWLADRARRTGHRIPVRLVKGAYWDTEIKFAQIEGLDDYPVFTRKCNTDLSYLACARKLLAHPDCFYAQFATHNAHTIAVIAEMAQQRQDFEYQRLHGMGEALYNEVLDNPGFNGACRVYAPVGNHQDLLPYLVRRLLENGANTSFVNRIVDEKLPADEVVTDPLEQVEGLEQISHPRIPLPIDLFGADRRNSRGINFAWDGATDALREQMDELGSDQWGELDCSTGQGREGTDRMISPANLEDCTGFVRWSSADEARAAVDKALSAQPEWDAVGASARADVLDTIADALESNRAELMALCVREAGKTLHDGIAEVREAADFCRYYAQQARERLDAPLELPGPTGESNQLSYHGRGVFVCISPWNFPLAIFTGQVVAALVTGNTVIAKPAEQTPLIALRTAELMHQAGVPTDVLNVLPGDGSVGAALTKDPRIHGVAFTGSTATARMINTTLAARGGPLATLIAETGGLNAMVVDSSALPEQVVRDVISSAFHSAGQRCSALRVLCLQADIADRVLEMLKGAMREIRVGMPGLLSTDVGPVIDQSQLEMLENHCQRMDGRSRLIARAPLPEDLPEGYWFAPCAYEIDAISELEQEIFGPVLHVVRYAARDIDKLIDEINGTGYGLTLGVHSRIDRFQRHVAGRVKVGNAYVNRNMTGAVVGVQPFGGEGLSGTGPKAGGPQYLFRFTTERTRTVNTAAVGGNASLLALSD